MQGQHAQPDRGQHDRQPGRWRDLGPQDQRAEQRCGDDVQPGDEARHAGRGVGQPDGLQDLGDAVQQAEQDPAQQGRPATSAAAARRQQQRQAAIANRTASRSATGIRVTMSLIMKNVEPQAAVIASSADEGDASSCTRDRASAQPSAAPSRRPSRLTARPAQTTYRVMVEPLGAWLRARGSV